jgi:hypothetical protein
MKMTIARTSPAVPSGPTMGPSHAKPEKPVLRGDDDGPGGCAARRLRFPEVGLDVFDRVLELFDRSPRARAADVGDLRQDVRAVARKILGERVHLPRQPPAGETEDGEHQRHHREHGRDAADPSFQPGDRRRQDEGEQDGERDRHQHGLRPIQDDHDEHTPGERDPSPQCLGRGIHRALRGDRGRPAQVLRR